MAVDIYGRLVRVSTRLSADRCGLSALQDPAAEARMKVACITEQVLTLVNKRLGLYRHFDETINKYKQSRDVSTLNSGKKSLETEHKAVTSEIAVLQSRLKTEGSDLCDRVSISVVNHLSVALHAPLQGLFLLVESSTYSAPWAGLGSRRPKIPTCAGPWALQWCQCLWWDTKLCSICSYVTGSEGSVPPSRCQSLAPSGCACNPSTLEVCVYV